MFFSYLKVIITKILQNAVEREKDADNLCECIACELLK